MRRPFCLAPTLITLLLLLLVIGCSKPATENPFTYPFIKEFRLKREPGKPYSDYKAFYVLTEDFEPPVTTASELAGIREVLKFASDLSSKYKIPWTHFVEANTLAPAFTSDDEELKQRCREMISNLKSMSEDGDDCELHLHGPLNRELLEQLRSQEKLHVKQQGVDAIQPYRQRRSFFFNSFYGGSYHELVANLTYGKRLLEKVLYDGKKQVLAFRPGGWDHGSTSLDTLLYFHALSDSGLIANSGLSTGDFGGKNWRVGNDPGHNVARISAGDDQIIEVSPTAGPGGYVNPVLPADLKKLATSVGDAMPVLVSVYHLGGLLLQRDGLNEYEKKNADLQTERELLERHFQTVSELAEARILYPITLRELLTIVSEQQ